MTFESQTLMCFSQIADWERLLGEAIDPVCIQAQKTRCRIMSQEEAERLAIQRGKRQTGQRRRKAEAAQELGGLLKEDDGWTSNADREWTKPIVLTNSLSAPDHYRFEVAARY